MQAVIRSGNHQFLVSPGQVLEIDLVGDDAKKLSFEPLLVIDSDKVTVGTPLVSGVTVTAEVVEEVKGDKLKVLKFQPKKRVKKLTGHRQHFTQIKITAIGRAKAPAAKAEAKKPAPKTAAKQPASVA